YGSSTQSWSAGSGWGATPVGGVISNLNPLTAYHYRLVASNAAGTSYGADAQFTTTAGSPLVRTEPRTNRILKGAALHGTVNPQGDNTYYQFEYGPTASYGTSVPLPSEFVGSGVQPVALSRSISSLHSETTYHYRIMAANGKGISYGGDTA